jgi:hypothetical protein
MRSPTRAAQICNRCDHCSSVTMQVRHAGAALLPTRPDANRRLPWEQFNEVARDGNGRPGRCAAILRVPSGEPAANRSRYGRSGSSDAAESLPSITPSVDCPFWAGTTAPGLGSPAQWAGLFRGVCALIGIQSRTLRATATASGLRDAPNGVTKRLAEIEQDLDTFVNSDLGIDRLCPAAARRGASRHHWQKVAVRRMLRRRQRRRPPLRAATSHAAEGARPQASEAADAEYEDAVAAEDVAGTTHARPRSRTLSDSRILGSAVVTIPGALCGSPATRCGEVCGRWSSRTRCSPSRTRARVRFPRLGCAAGSRRSR